LLPYAVLEVCKEVREAWLGKANSNAKGELEIHLSRQKRAAEELKELIVILFVITLNFKSFKPKHFNITKKQHSDGVILNFFFNFLSESSTE